VTGELSWVLVGLSFICLLGFGFGGVLVSQSQAHRQKSARRMLEVVAPYRKKRAGDMNLFRPSTEGNRSLLEIAASIFAIHREKLDQYPVRWWIVLGVTLLVARVAAGFMVGFMGPLGIIGLPVLWVALCRFFFGWVVRRRQGMLFRQFPEALAMIVRALRVGVPVLGAITAVAREAEAPTSTEFTRLSSSLAIGVPLEEAATQMARRNGSAEYAFFATAIGLQARMGGGLSETLDNLADLIRKRLALRERAHALSSEARTSAMILGGLPIVMGAGLWLFNPGYMSVLYTDSTGRIILGSAVLMLGFGALAMQTIIKKSLS
jgi:tight adherence protein B